MPKNEQKENLNPLFESPSKPATSNQFAPQASTSDLASNPEKSDPFYTISTPNFTNNPFKKT